MVAYSPSHILPSLHELRLFWLITLVERGQHRTWLQSMRHAFVLLWLRDDPLILAPQSDQQSEYQPGLPALDPNHPVAVREE
jgi:hypothetical protein